MHGYTTGTFDLLHDGHFQILRLMRQQCARLTVGLTTDELGARQKRPPVLSFAHRQAVLRHCRHVDAVVAHSGETKQEAHRRLGFDLLFIGDDYADSPEYAGLPDGVTVRILPRTPGVCTSELWRGLQRRCLDEMAPLALSLSGPVLRAGDGTVVKPVHVGATEHDPEPTLSSTDDRYGVGLPEPRNWKGTEDDLRPRHPCVPGISPYRELLVAPLLRRYRWYTVRAAPLKYENPDAPRREDEPDPVRRLLAERRQPRAVHWLLQRDAGTPLDRWAATATAEQRADARAQVRRLIDDLKSQGVVHGDVHGQNLCVDAEGRVSLLDFGWCLWRGFHLSEAERQLLERRLADDFDWTHFERCAGGAV